MAGEVSQEPDGERRNTCKQPDCNPTHTWDIILGLSYLHPLSWI